MRTEWDQLTVIHCELKHAGILSVKIACLNRNRGVEKTT